MFKRIEKWVATMAFEHAMRKAFKKLKAEIASATTREQADAAIVKAIIEKVYSPHAIFIQIETETPKETETVDQLLARLGMKTKKEN